MAAEPDLEYDTSGGSVTQPEDMDELFPDGEYQDIPGLCNVATVIPPDKCDRQLFSQTCNEVFDHVWQRY